MISRSTNAERPRGLRARWRRWRSSTVAELIVGLIGGTLIVAWIVAVFAWKLWYGPTAIREAPTGPILTGVATVLDIIPMSGSRINPIPGAAIIMRLDGKERRIERYRGTALHLGETVKVEYRLGAGGYFHALRIEEMPRARGAPPADPAK